MRLDQFSVSFYSSGAPKEFKSTVTILEGDRQVLTESIRVNHPLTYKGISFYQSSYGVAGREKGRPGHSGPGFAERNNRSRIDGDEDRDPGWDQFSSS